ncbi:hypothetical protein DB346_06625 [Verrucomicrobia bacterium LW23]|nr:hypothetical protein DB346_06625 [Verrucomicrobia bacterium LW23]
MKSASSPLPRAAMAAAAAISAIALLTPTPLPAKDTLDTYAHYAQRQNKWDLIERDNMLGLTPGQVSRKWGRPVWSRTTSAARLYVKIPPERLDLYKGPGTSIRVCGYAPSESGFKRIVYFAPEAGGWRVIGDVEAPGSLAW